MSEAVAPIQILLVDDHTLFREGLRRLLDSENGFRVCGDFGTAEQALAAISEGLAFDVALLDYDLAASTGAPGNGLDLLGRVRVLRPEAKALMVTAGMVIGDLRKALDQFNAGVFLKTEPTAELMLAIQRTVRGERWVSSGAVLTLLAGDKPPASKDRAATQLSTRESQVLRGVLEGLGNKEIGARMGLTESTVKAVLQKLFEKTGVRSRSQLVRFAIERQIDLG